MSEQADAVELWSTETTNPFSGEYGNSILAAKNENGSINLYISWWNIDDSGSLPVSDQITDPEDFVEACMASKDQGVEFDEFDYENIRSAFVPELKKLDSAFAEAVNSWLIKELERIEALDEDGEPDDESPD
jgi:hypothetical protein